MTSNNILRRRDLNDPSPGMSSAFFPLILLILDLSLEESEKIVLMCDIPGSIKHSFGVFGDYFYFKTDDFLVRRKTMAQSDVDWSIIIPRDEATVRCLTFADEFMLTILFL